jgi:glycosyltransferase involved in cell wall biosynthesis
MPEIILSVLICSLHKRFGMLGKLLRNLEYQITDAQANDLVEVLVNADGGEKSTGRKRNELLRQARGKYVMAVDDDDRVSERYIVELLEAAKSDADCFSISGYMWTNGVNKRDWHISNDYEYCTKKNSVGEDEYFRFPNHITPIKREIAVQFEFPDKYQFEDFEWASKIKASGLIKTEHRIDYSPMYIYDFISKK